MHAAKSWLLEQLGKKAAEALRINGFDAVFVPNAEAARAAVFERIPRGASVGFGGSMTLQEIGLIPMLEAGGFDLINPPNRKLPDDKAERDAIRRRAVQADVCLAGANAITLGGEIASTDGTGNRLVTYLFGPKATILVAGVNKIVSDIYEAQQRIRQVAAPANARRIQGTGAPCTIAGVCDDAACAGANRICNATVILHKRPSGVEQFSVIIVGEDLGF
jgi:L-lactate utilization protein LutB